MRLTLLTLLICCVAGITLLSPISKQVSWSTGSIDFASRALPSESAAAEVQLPKRIIFLGDVFLGRRVEQLLDSNGAAYVYARVPAFSTATEYVVANFEASAPRVHLPTPEMRFRFSVDQMHLEGLSAFGVTHVSLGNNHSYDAGSVGYHETREALSREGIVPFGDQVVSTTTETLLFLEGQEVVIFGLYAVNTAPDYNLLRSRLSAYATDTYSVAYIHWGTEYVPVHTAAVEDTARQLVDLGFDLIVGHHPHVVQDIDLIAGVPVVYSLGNFIFDQYFSAPVQEGLALALSVSATSTELTLLPHTSLDARSQPRYLQGEEKQVFLDALAVRSSAMLQPAIQGGRLLLPRTAVANISQSTSIAE